MVEDNVLNQVVAVGILTRLGYAADVVENGRDAVEAVTRGAYGAVLMDCRLPGLDGYQATAEIRRREGGSRHVPIVAMTASASHEDRERCLAADMDDYLAKPVLVGDLDAALTRWLPEAILRGTTPAIPRTPPPRAAVAVEPAADVIDHHRLAALMELDQDQRAFSRRPPSPNVTLPPGPLHCHIRSIPTRVDLSGRTDPVAAGQRCVVRSGQVAGRGPAAQLAPAGEL
jgi:CheY-like chemotaxis protein